MEAIGALTKEDAQKARSSKKTAYQDSCTTPYGREHDDEAVLQEEEEDSITDGNAMKYAITKVCTFVS
jgi:hypothetical protein